MNMYVKYLLYCKVYSKGGLLTFNYGHDPLLAIIPTTMKHQKCIYPTSEMY